MKPVIVDVREPHEYEAGHVEGALNIPPAKLLLGAKDLADVPKDAPIILYCKSGSRSNVAMHMLRAQGYTNLTNGINKDQVQAKHLSS